MTSQGIDQQQYYAKIYGGWLGGQHAGVPPLAEKPQLEPDVAIGSAQAEIGHHNKRQAAA